MENLGYLMAAYTIVWICLAGYIFTIVLRQRKQEEDIKNLKEQFDANK